MMRTGISDIYHPVCYCMLPVCRTPIDGVNVVLATTAREYLNDPKAHLEEEPGFGTDNSLLSRFLKNQIDLEQLSYSHHDP